MIRQLLGRRLPATPPAPPPQPDPEHAWRLLGLMNEWIRHSDSKAGVTLAFSGVLGTMTFNLATGFGSRTLMFDALVVLTCILLALTAALCAWTLTPRVNDKDADPQAINRIFFASISQHFKGDRPRYQEVLSTLTADPSELVRDLADQVHANANIATIKGRCAKWAVRAALATGAAVAGLAVLVGVASLQA